MTSPHIDSVLIWDSVSSPPGGNFTTILWRGFVTQRCTNTISIPALIEENADVLKNRYLAWLYELGNLRVNDRSLIEHLEIRPGFSYWWMTLLAEKSNYSKSPLINDLLRFFAFDDWSANFSKFKSIKLVSSNHRLEKCLKSWCKTRGVDFEWQKIPSKPEPKTRLRKAVNQLPNTIQAGVWLIKYLIDRWPLRGVGVDEWKKASGKSTFVSYFFNLVPKAAKEGCFESLYWTTLPTALDTQKVNSAWLHIYVKNADIPNATSARRLICKFNATCKEHQVHVFLDSFLDLKAIWCAFRDFMNVRRFGRIYFTKIFLLENKSSLAAERTALHLFEEDWHRSFFGVDAISNTLMLNLFEKAFSSLPVQTNGIYLQENMGWEFGMIHAWRAANHQKLVGFPHATVRFWDLRYFFDPRSYSKHKTGLPMPDLVAVDGDAKKNAYLHGGYPAENLVEVEALRYLHLSRIDKDQIQLRSFSAKQSKILILGDYLRANTAKQISLLQEIADELTNIELIVKTHPACPIDVSDFPELKLKLTTESLPALLGDFDIAYSSSVTSSAVDAYTAGLKVITFLDPTTLNISPLREVAGVLFVSSAEMLRDALLQVSLQSGVVHDKVDYFNLDSTLPRWKTLLSDNLKCGRS